MQVTETDLPGVLLIEPAVFGDERGFFIETWQQARYEQTGIDLSFVQDNFSSSQRGTLRGLHFQKEHAQGKLVFVTLGAIWDVAVDVRRDSPNFGRWVGIELNDENHRQLYIPPGFAHGFCVLSERAHFHYKCTDRYAPESERTLLWNDPAVGVDWPLQGEPILSEKDRHGTPLADLDAYETSP